MLNKPIQIQTLNAERPTEPMPFGDVLFPLRVDVPLISKTLAFYDGNKDLWQKNREEFYRQARSTYYYRNLSLVPAVHWRAQRGKRPWNQRHLETVYRKQMARWFAVYEAIVAGGYNSQYPITIYKPKRALKTTDGFNERHVPQQTFFMGNGRHRTAILIHLGQTGWLPGQYIVKHIQPYTPWEVTHLYMRHGWVSEQQFMNFVGMSIAYPACIETVDELFEWLSHRRGQQLVRAQVAIARYWYKEQYNDPDTNPIGC